MALILYKNNIQLTVEAVTDDNVYVMNALILYKNNIQLLKEQAQTLRFLKSVNPL